MQSYILDIILFTISKYFRWHDILTNNEMKYSIESSLIPHSMRMWQTCSGQIPSSIDKLMNDDSMDV
jgi:hypothetical protein